MRKPGSNTFRVCYFNTRRGKALRKGSIERKLKRKKPDVAHLFECGSSKKDVRVTARAAGYIPYFGDGEPGAASTPVLVQKDLRHEFVGAFEISEPGLWVGHGAGPSYAKGKYCMIVRVWKDETWKSGGVHFTPSIYLSRRRKVVKAQARAARAAMRNKVSGPGIRVLGGDLNATWDTWAGRQVLRVLQKAGLRFAQRRKNSEPTHGDRAIDHSLFGSLAWLVRRQTFNLNGSDHKGLLADYRRL